MEESYPIDAAAGHERVEWQNEETRSGGTVSGEFVIVARPLIPYLPRETTQSVKNFHTVAYRWKGRKEFDCDEVVGAR